MSKRIRLLWISDIEANCRKVRHPLLPTPCWIWRGKTDRNGYVRKWHEGRHQSIQIIACDFVGRAVPVGKEGHHLCERRNCANPGHVQFLTHAEHMAVTDFSANGLGNHNRKKTHCPHGHKYTKSNTKLSTTAAGYQKRNCRKCANARNQAYEQRNKI